PVGSCRRLVKGTRRSPRDQSAQAPHLRLGGRSVNLLWTIPLAIVVLSIGWGACSALRTLPAVQGFIAQYPGSVVPPGKPQGFPWWLRWQHFLNLLFLVPLVRSGLQLWAGRPRLYWQSPPRSGAEWLRIRDQSPGGRSIRDDAVSLPGWLGLPGQRHASGIARWWHLGVDMLWLANGTVFYILLFSTGQWARIVPTSWDIFPNALSALIQYLSLDFPNQNSWTAYNALQLLAYFITVFVAAPLAVVTGLLQSPVISRKLRATASRWANPEVARSAHVLVLGWFIAFIAVHVTMVFATGALTNLNHITTGRNDQSWAGAVLFGIGTLVVAVVWAAATPLTRRHPHLVQRAAQRLLGRLSRLF
ncbi:MAG: cytochrome b/b6 domain-containing protein, partial [Microbacteriaceae bacterium]